MSKVDLKTLPHIHNRKFKFEADNFEKAIKLIES